MINLNLSPDQRQIVDAVRAMLEVHFPVARLRGWKDRAPDNLAPIIEFGGFAMSVAERAGGLGLSVVEDVLLHVELGRHLVSPSSLAGTLAAHLAAEAGDAELLTSLLAGDATVCLGNVVKPSTGPQGPATLHLYDVEGGEPVLVVAADWLAMLDSSRLSHRSLPATDRSIRLATAEVGAGALANARRRAAAGAGSARLAPLLISAQLLGMCEAVRDMTVAYAKVRTQFGQPIASFQAVKHRCANMEIDTQVLSAQLVFAAIAERDAWPDAAFQIDTVHRLARRYALRVCRDSIQVHGGMGFSAECDAHFYLLRAHLFEFIGTVSHVRPHSAPSGTSEILPSM